MIHSYAYCKNKFKETGEVVEVKEFLVKVKGLPNAAIAEAVVFKTGEAGRVMEIEKETVEVLVFSRNTLKIGVKAARTGGPLEISCGSGLLGRTINVLGHAIDKKRHKSASPEARFLESRPGGIANRRKINRFFSTGVSSVDLILPLGYGQRELILGDRKTGKTNFILQALTTQAKSGSICIYCGVGKRKSEIKQIEEFLKEKKIFNRSVIIAADSYSSPAEIFLCPYAGLALAEYFRDKGNDVLVVLDDLTTHAKYYREISLILGAFPGRESYPGDIFHIQSKILERAGCFDVKGHEVAITCLPIAESASGDFTGYIQTNLMSMTDGHLYFDYDLFSQGRRPAINPFLSVTRVGRQTQSPLARDINIKIMALLKKYEDTKRFLRFGPELTGEIKATLSLGEGLIRFFNQAGFTVLPFEFQAVLVSLLWLKLWDGKIIGDLDSLLEDRGFCAVLNNLVVSSKSLEDLNRLAQTQQGKLLKLTAKGAVL